ncbi:hypothetical protein BH20VER2_BH20VER2_11940 [soil metagenome]
MKTIKYGLLVAVAFASALIAADQNEKAQGTDGAETKAFHLADLKWGAAPPGLPSGAQLAVLSGDPTKKGVFTVRLRMPAGYKIPPHTHPTAELVTVISGSIYRGNGERFDESAGQKMEVGSFASFPAGVKHFAWTTEDSVIQIHGEGPFGIEHVDPETDPRNAKR